MCGIAGRPLCPSRPSIHEAPLLAAAASLDHRGPDGSEVWAEQGVGLAHTRLAIIDRAHGGQPMFSADDRYVVVFNGEIYNHQELRRDLESPGYRLKTDCDTEVLLYLFDWLGDSMVERLRGMFAFVDLRSSRVVAPCSAGDRFGKKPFYFAEAGGALTFASTLDALRSLLPIARTSTSTRSLSTWCCSTSPSPLTPYRGLRKLPPGCAASWSARGLRAWPYWVAPQRSPGASQPGSTSRTRSGAFGNSSGRR